VDSSTRLVWSCNSLDEWRSLLADPQRHWKPGHSAKTLACSWYSAGGFPPEVAAVFANAPYLQLHDLKPIAGLPEFRVPLPGGNRPSQSDLFILASSAGRLVTITIEGKAREPFGPTLREWLEKPTKGRQQRLASICELLQLPDQLPQTIRYQLLHRTAASVLAAQTFCCNIAIMLVHSFGTLLADSVADYQDFLSLFDASAGIGELAFVGCRKGIDIYFGWAQGEEKWLQEQSDQLER
jgi:hypothetical protein